MEKTLFAILTDERARKSELIEASLDREFMAGAPWFGMILAEPSNVESVDS